MSLKSALAGGLGPLVLLYATSAAAGPDGRQLYIDHCSACHQTEGRGGIGLPLARAKLAEVSDDYLRNTIRLGRPGRVMPAFQRLSDAQVDAIVAFVRATTDTVGVAEDTTRIQGDAANGRRLYAAHCVKCHGEDGSGEGQGTGVTLSREREFLVMPASISNPGFLAAATDEMIRRVIAAGREASDMPAFGDGKLSAAEISDLVVYLRSFEASAAEPAALNADQRPTRVYESPYDFDTTVANIKLALTGANFRIFPDRLLEEGLVDEFSVNTRQIGIRFCNFNSLYGMLKVEPRLGVVLPCRITILERSDGSVILVVPNLRVIARWFNNDELIGLWDAMQSTFVDIIEEATL